jgi:hypothetical protein
MNREQRRAAARAQRGHSKPPAIRKVWRTDIDTMEHAKAGAAITTEQARDQLMMRELTALDAFTRGHARMQEWSDLVNLNNIAQTMAGSLGVMRDEVLPACHLAEQDLIETAARYQRTGRMGLSGQAIEHMRAVIRLHEQQRASVARSVYEEAIRLTGARIKSGHATIDLAATPGTPMTDERKAA